MQRFVCGVLVVLDTNVLVAGLRSSRGASNHLLQRAAAGQLRICVSTTLVVEYEAVLSRPGLVPHTRASIQLFIDSLCAVAHETHLFFKWRPFLPDPADDMVFECAMAAGASHIVTHNRADFVAAGDFGISVMTPGEFVGILTPP